MQYGINLYEQKVNRSVQAGADHFPLENCFNFPFPHYTVFISILGKFYYTKGLHNIARGVSLLQDVY